jgi:DNA-binding LacI/PurR family transcriptional regulator
MTTIRDIARNAHVSTGTVSNFLNNPDLVAPETRQTIQQTISELGYHPHAAARSLKSRQTRRIGLVPLISLQDNHSVDPGDTAFLEFLSAVNTAAAENGYDVLIAAATSSQLELSIYERLVGEHQVDALILMGMRACDLRVPFLQSHGFPFVAFGRSSSQADYAFVDVDGEAGITQSVRHLAGLGHRRIAYACPPDDLMLAAQRLRGFQQAMQESGLEIPDDYLVPAGFGEQAGQVAMHLLLDLSQPPTAVIFPNDLSAFGGMRALQLRGLQAGKDISVVGFDDIKLASHWHPALTTIAQPFRRVGFEVVQAVIKLLAHAAPLPQLVIEPRLVVRGSTGPARE